MDYEFFIFSRSNEDRLKILKLPLLENARREWSALIDDRIRAFQDLATVPYEVGYQPSDHEVFEIENFESEVDFFRYVKGETCDEFSAETHISLGQKAIIAVPMERKDDVVFFQVLDSRNIVEPTRGIFQSLRGYDTIRSHQFFLGKGVDVSFSEKTLKFKNFHQAKKYSTLK